MSKYDNLNKWLDALRSGQYSRALGQLKSSLDYNREEYCCLGVACEIYRQETGKGEWVNDAFQLNGISYKFELPKEVVDWLGLKNNHALVELANTEPYPVASEMNDSDEYEFPEIADVIERTHKDD